MTAGLLGWREVLLKNGQIVFINAAKSPKLSNRVQLTLHRIQR
jgi:hypothetical protein